MSRERPKLLKLFSAALHDRTWFKSLNPQERQAARVEKRGELLVWSSTGEAVSTKNMIGKSTRVGRAVSGLAAYALDQEGVLHIHEHRTSESHPKEKPGNFFSHASFFDGDQGLCFGMISVEEGRTTYVDNESGHYLPSQDHLDYLLSHIAMDERCQVIAIAMNEDSDCESHSSAEMESAPQANPSGIASLLSQLGVIAATKNQAPLQRSDSDSSIIDHGPSSSNP